MDICEKTEAYQQKQAGLGGEDFQIGLCIGNFPSCLDIESVAGIRFAGEGELSHIVEQTGNHWRKIFNICAKIGFALWPEKTQSWQQYRDSLLFRQSASLCLFFSPPPTLKEGQLLLILGKQYRREIFPDAGFTAVSEVVYRHPELPIYQVPYFDYRQLPNKQLDALILLLRQELN